jgi:hypothetical protein
VLTELTEIDHVSKAFIKNYILSHFYSKYLSKQNRFHGQNFQRRLESRKTVGKAEQTSGAQTSFSSDKIMPK